MASSPSSSTSTSPTPSITKAEPTNTTTTTNTTTLPSDVLEKDIPITPPGILDPSKRTIWTPVAKDWATFEKYGRETSGAYTLLTVSVAPGGQNATHYHGSYSETFTADKGDVGIYSRTTGKIILRPGESVTVPPGEEHCFFNPGTEENVQMKIKLHPAREGFEKGLYILYGLARDGKSANGGIPNNFVYSSVIFAMSDMWPTGLAGRVVTPLMKVCAWVGKVTGVEDRLVKKYWVV